ncbi:extracellular matrix regulator RemB [Sinobaca sp. H24]|uniref:extracellular matrix regulator RemB n=1 Tax=Sinobaca sp. H24 TaxID=2923376 RepID=UPI0027E2BE71|nr:extracellular matrix/biofilm biosynthesis regulator RemA family protein [Sinobaca sp. H24]
MSRRQWSADTSKVGRKAYVYSFGRGYDYRSKDVVAILDETSHASSKDTARFMDSRQNSQVVEITEDYTKSVVVTHDKVYLSPISSLTLKRRRRSFQK